MPDKTEVTECFECVWKKLEEIEDQLSRLRPDVSETISIIIDRNLSKIFGTEYWTTYLQQIEEKGPLLARLAIIEQKLQTIKPLHEYRKFFEEIKSELGIKMLAEIQAEQKYLSSNVNQFIQDYVVFKNDMKFWREQTRKKPWWKFW